MTSTQEKKDHKDQDTNGVCKHARLKSKNFSIMIEILKQASILIFFLNLKLAEFNIMTTLKWERYKKSD